MTEPHSGFLAISTPIRHLADNKAMKLASEVLREQARQSDLVARLGDAEVTILMPGIGEADCGSACRHLTAIIAKRMATSSQSPRVWDNFDFPPLAIMRSGRSSQ